MLGFRLKSIVFRIKQVGGMTNKGGNGLQYPELRLGYSAE